MMDGGMNGEMLGMEARALVAHALERSIDEIEADGALGEVPGWDSLGHMRIVLSIEDRLKRPLAATEVVALKSVADISALLAHCNGKSS